MFKRLEKPCTVFHLCQSVDKYGQQRLEWDEKTETKALYYITGKSTASNPDFEDVDAVALMKIKDLDQNYILEIEGTKYRILYSYPRMFGHRYTQYFLRDTTENPVEKADFFYKLDTDVTTVEEEGALHLHLSAEKGTGYSPVVIEGEEFVAPWVDDNTNLYEVTFETAIQPTSIYRWFDASNIITIHNLNRLDLTKCTTMQWAFRDCHNLAGDIKFSTGAPLNKSLRSTFKNCNVVDSIDVTGLCTSNCTSLNSLFHSCYQLKKIIGLNTFDTSNVTEFTCLFNFCYVLNRVDGIEGWDTRNVEKMNGVFYSCRRLPFIHIPNWDFSKADTVANMFRDCRNAGSIDIKKFTPSSVLTTMSRMFADAQELACINCDDIYCYYPEGCIVSNVFTNCSHLPNWGEGTSANSWNYYVRGDCPTCPTVTYLGITNQSLRFSYTVPDPSDMSWSFEVLPEQLTPDSGGLHWHYDTLYATTRNKAVAWSFYSEVDNRTSPFRFILRQQGYLCSYCDEVYPVLGYNPMACIFDYDPSTLTFTSTTQELTEDEWYAYTTYDENWEQVPLQGNSYLKQEYFTLNLTAGTYTVWIRRCRHHYNPSYQYIEITIE